MRRAVIAWLVIVAGPGILGTRGAMSRAQATNTALHDAVRKKDAGAVAAALREHAGDVNARDGQGTTALHMAARQDQGAIVALLLDHGADPRARDSKGRTPLALCITYDFYRKSAAGALVARGADAGLTAEERGRLLHRAARHGDRAVVESLVARGTDLRTPRSDGGTLLHSAAAGGLVDLADRLLARGFGLDDRDRYGMTPLHYAAAHGQIALVQKLLTAGADSHATDAGGRRPLHLALLYERTEVAGALRRLASDERPLAFPRPVRGPYLGESSPGLEPRLFARGIVSTFEWEHGAPVFSPDGNEVFWTSCLHVRSSCSVFTSVRRRGEWRPAELAPFASSYGEAYPAFSTDGNTLFFQSYRPTGPDEPPNRGKLWKVTRTSSGWSTAALAWPDVLGGYTIASGATVARSGNLYFSMYREDGRGGFDIYVSRPVNDSLSRPEPLTGDVNSEYDESIPCVSPDERFLIFNSGDRPGNLGAYDLYVAVHRPDGTWGAPVHLPPPVNGGGVNWLPSLSPDGRYFFFSSDRNGNIGDVYWIDAKVIGRILATQGG